jgi:hypothetical protein
VSRTTSVEWLILVAGFSLLCAGVYAFLYGVTGQIAALSGLLVVLVAVLWVRERTTLSAQRVD